VGFAFGYFKRVTTGKPIWVYQIGVFAVILIVWELIVRLRVIDTFFLASPTMILSCIGTVLKRPDIIQAFLTTLIEILIAYGLAAAFGVTLGMVLGLSDPLYRGANGIILMLYGVPKSMIIPLFILYFGIGINSKIAFGAVHGFFPILLNTLAGARSVEPSMITMGRSLGANRIQMFTRIIFPSILPNAFTGLRLGMNHTLLGVLLAELFVSQKGIGYYINLLTSTFKTEELFAIIAALAAIAIVANGILGKFESRFSLWRQL